MSTDLEAAVAALAAQWQAAEVATPGDYGNGYEAALRSCGEDLAALLTSSPAPVEPTAEDVCPTCRNGRDQPPVLALPHGTAPAVCGDKAWHWCGIGGCTRPWGHPYGAHTGTWS